MLVGHLGVVGDATIAVDRNADGESHELLHFRVDGAGGRGCRRKRGKRLHGVGRALPECADTGHDVIGDLYEILAHCQTLRDSERKGIGSVASAVPLPLLIIYEAAVTFNPSAVWPGGFPLRLHGRELVCGDSGVGIERGGRSSFATYQTVSPEHPQTSLPSSLNDTFP